MKRKKWQQIGFHGVVALYFVLRWLCRVKVQPNQASDDRLVIGYIRQSMTRWTGSQEAQGKDHDALYDMNSPDRQRHNIYAAAKKYKLPKPRIYQDAKGHKSGADIANRPDWQKVEKLIVTGKVRVLILNDLSRAHRKGWRVGRLIEWLEKYHVRLILAAPDREVDVSSIMGKMFLLFISMTDEYYVLDASLRQKDNIATKRRQGKTIALPPFGSVRNQDGYLMLTQRGAWLLADGRHVAGIQDEVPPEADAIWRGYADCTRHVMRLYTQRNRLGYCRIAFQLNLEGWAFRTQKYEPRPFTCEDVRRIIAAWPLYAGIVVGGKATARQAKDNLSLLDSAPAGRAIFPLTLLRRVAQAQEERSLNRRGDGSVAKAFPYLRDLYCAHCERKAIAMHNPKLRRRLGGTKNSYRHPQDTPCICHARSVPMAVVNAAIGTVLESVAFRDESLTAMHDLAASVEAIRITRYEDLEARRRVALCKTTQRLRNLEALYRDGEMEHVEYEARHRKVAKKIADLKNQAKHLKSTAIHLAQGVEQISDLAHLWRTTSDLEKRLLAKLLFDTIIFDLDERRIVAYTLQPWLLPLIIPPANLTD